MYHEKCFAWILCSRLCRDLANFLKNLHQGSITWRDLPVTWRSVLWTCYRVLQFWSRGLESTTTTGLNLPSLMLIHKESRGVTVRNSTQGSNTCPLSVSITTQRSFIGPSNVRKLAIASRGVNLPTCGSNLLFLVEKEIVQRTVSEP